MNGTVKSGESSRGMLFGVFVLASIYPLFTDITPNSIQLLSMLFAAILLLFYAVNEAGKIHLPSVDSGLLWLVFGVCALFSILLRTEGWTTHTLFQLMAITLVCLSSANAGWIRPLYKTIVVLLAVHAVATIVFWLFPSFYSSYVDPVFFAEETNSTAHDYRSGLTSHYSYNGMYLVTGFLLTGSLLVCRWSSGRERPLLIGLVCMFAFALLLTTKRSHIGFGFLGLLAGFMVSRGSMKAFKATALVAVALLVVFCFSQYIPALQETILRFSETFDASASLEETTTGRTQLWEFAIAGWRESPLFGHGWGSYYYVWPGGKSVSIGAHNVYLQLLYEGGAFACVLFVAAQFVTLVQSFRLCLYNRRTSCLSSELYVAAVFSFSFQVFFLAYCFFGNPLYDPQMVYPFFVSVAMAYAASASLRGDEAAITRRPGGRRLSDSAPKEEIPHA